MTRATENIVPSILDEPLDGFRILRDPEQMRADIVLDRPPLNIVTMKAREQLRRVLEALDSDDAVRVIVLRASGKHFSSGGLIAGFLEKTPEELTRLAEHVGAPARCRKPVIAASRGYCFGVGFELSLACDFRIASETCVYSLPEQKIGMIPGSGGSARLMKMIGITRTMEVVMRAKRIPGQQAADWGIATECVKDDMLESATNSLVDELLSFSPLATRALKKALRDAEEATLSLGIELEGQAYGRLRASDDYREGVAAFIEKRAPRFRGT
jgi:2-oxoglutaroyl-CoA hydrolase